MTYGEDILIYEAGVRKFVSLDQCISSPLAVYSNLKPVGIFTLLEAGWHFSMKPVGSLFVPDGSELEPGGDEYVAELGIRLPSPSSPTSYYFLVLLFFLGFDRSLFLGTDV